MGPRESGHDFTCGTPIESDVIVNLERMLADILVKLSRRWATIKGVERLDHMGKVVLKRLLHKKHVVISRQQKVYVNCHNLLMNEKAMSMNQRRERKSHCRAQILTHPLSPRKKMQHSAYRLKFWIGIMPKPVENILI